MTNIKKNGNQLPKVHYDTQYLSHLVRKDYARAAKVHDSEIAKAEFENFRNGSLSERTFMCLEVKST